jgi:phosphoadenosine phosphosulfate reductase
MASAAVRARDVIVASPEFTTADAATLDARYAALDARALVDAIIEDGVAANIALVSSFGAESAVLMHLVRQVADLPLVFVNTQKMFGETLAYRDELVERLVFTRFEVVRPDAASLARIDPTGLRWSYDPDGCCETRKVEPLRRALAGYDAWISGRKGFQAGTRTALPRIEADEGRLKINPLADWDKAAIEAYFDAHDLPRHPLVAEGYPSIGCVPCTSKVQPGEDPRAGRWRGWDKVECGIHTPLHPGNEPAF